MYASCLYYTIIFLKLRYKPGRGITNYGTASIKEAVGALAEAGLSTSIMVDCSHDNACKQAEHQTEALLRSL